MSTEPRHTCADCGSEFSGALEFCPVCMLRQALAGGVESGESSASADTVKQTPPEQAVQRFEHYELVTGETGNQSSWVAMQWASLTNRRRAESSPMNRALMTFNATAHRRLTSTALYVTPIAPRPSSNGDPFSRVRIS